MNLILMCLYETWIESSTYPNRIIDPQNNITFIENKKIISTNINFWLIDSKIYSLFLSYKGFGFNLRYFDFGSFNYQNDIPNDYQTFTFSPFSIYSSISKKFEIEKNLYFGLSIGYYENRVLDEIKSSPFISLSSNLKLNEKLNLIFLFENFSFKKLFSANQLELPNILSFGFHLNLNQFKITAGANRYYKFEKFISFEYNIRNLLDFGIVYTPDYNYSKISALLKVKYKNLYFGYKAYIPSYLNFTNTIGISYEAP